MSAEHDLAKAIADAVDAKVANTRPESSTMPATYQGRDSEGKGWVLLPGATEPTPVSRMAVEAAQGDTVSVTIANGKATVDSNVSNPSAGIAGVKTVERTANAANETAGNALTAAADARTAAASAQSSADTARQAATDATLDAATARSMAESATADAATASASAAIAKTSADKATYALSDVENVVGTLNWIAEHGEYVLTEDTDIVEGKAYYTRSGTDPDYVYTVVASPVASELSTYYELSLDESVQNYLASHLWLDDYGLNLSVDSANGYRVHQGTVDGTHSPGAYIIDPQGAIVASFGASGFQVGLDNESHMVGDYHSFQLLDKEGDTYFWVSDLRNRDGYADMSESFTADGTTKYYTVTYSLRSAETTTVTVDGTQSTFALLGDKTVVLTATPEQDAVVTVSYQSNDTLLKAYTLGTRLPSSVIGPCSIVMGRECAATGTNSYAEGGFTTASDTYSHAEGCYATASGWGSHAEGGFTIASGMYSHAEGYSAATEWGSHSEGNDTIASGKYSHAQNNGTKASSESQTALGKYNVEDTNGDYAVIVGNGTLSPLVRSNALTVDWDGNVGIAGDVNDLSGNAKYLAANSVTKSGSDLDNQTVGECWWGNGYTNAPNGSSGFFEVYRHHYYQIAYGFAGNAAKPTMYVRSNVNSTWQPWVRVDNGDVGEREVDDVSTNVECPNNAWKAVASVTLAAGIWVICGTVAFASNATGRRKVAINNGVPNASIQRVRGASTTALSGVNTELNVAATASLSSSGTWSIYAHQTSGSTLNATGCITAVRIK